MRAGNLRRRLTIQQKGTVTRNSHGEEVITWKTYATVWGEVSPLTGREYLAAQEAQSAVNVRVRMRYLAGVTTAMRVLYGSRVLEIEAVLNYQERNRELVLMCVEDAG